MQGWLIALIVFLSLAALGAILWYGVYSPCVRNRSERNLQTLGTSLLSAKPIDLSRYAGKWYEIARLPNTFEDGCLCSTATYTLKGQNELLIENECRKINGTRASAVGRAVPVNAANRAALRVNFAPQWLGPGAAGDYWILHVDENYRTALVGTPDRRYLWVLSRSPSLDQSTMRALLDMAVQRGFDISDIVFNRCTLFD